MDILQVAKRAKVSTATVSRVLNGATNVSEKTSAHVRRIVAELNYVPNRNARNLRVGKTRLFGLIVSDINNSFFPELIDTFESQAAEQGIEVIFTHTNYDLNRLQSCIRRMVDRNVDAIAVMTSEVEEKSLQQAISARIPLVLLNQQELEGKYPNVVVEYSVAFEEALEHLQSLGHRDIGFIAGPNSLNSAVRRKQAFQMALKHHGLSENSKWIVVGDMRVEGGRIAMEKLLSQKPRPTAVIASNDLMAVGALQAAHSASIRVPADISIVGFDDLPIAGMIYPPLTTMKLPRREIAARAFANLQTQLLGEAPPVRPPIQARLVIRESTASPPDRKRR